MDTDFDTKFNHYDTKARELGLRSVWSIYGIEDLDSLHPFGTDIQVAYVKDHDHWGDGHRLPVSMGFAEVRRSDPASDAYGR